MGLSREAICASVKGKVLGQLETVSKVKALVGLDGFVDEIIAVVDKRRDHERYEPMRKIEDFGKKICAAAGESSNYELVVKQRKLGGNGPIMANALASAGFGVTYVGTLGYPAMDPVFENFGKKAKLISVSDAGHTDALEFEDGKLMLGKITQLADLNWKNLVERVGMEKLMSLMGEASLIGLVNWTMLPHMSDIWKRMLAEVFPRMKGQGKKLFIDLADPEKRTKGDIVEAMELMGKIQEYVDVILGLNLKESGEILEVLGLPVAKDAEAVLEATAATIRERIGVSCVVIHPRRGAAAATKEGTARFAGPFVQQPKISTGAGDHFNAGFCLGQILGLSLEESLCTGVATSGYYVRTAMSPSAKELAEFIGELPGPEGESGRQ